MGYEQVFEGCMRSSVELRRINNAKVTARRHRKWQEVRLQREAREKKAAEEYLKRRKRERAQLAAYIYTSAQNMHKECGTKSSQEHTNRNQALAENRKDDFAGVKNQIIQKNRADEDITLDVCRLPAISLKNEPCCRPLQKHHAGDKRRETEATRDFLQEALQERLQNEAATSRLIAEITDMRSRLDDLLAKPLAGHNEGREVSSPESKDVKVSHSLSEQNHEENTNFQLQGAADDSDYRDKSPTNCSSHESLATSHLASKRLNCWSQKNDVLGNHKVNEVLPQLERGFCADAFACDQDTILAGKQVSCHPEGPSFQQKTNEERFPLKKTVCSTKKSKLTMGSDKENGVNQLEHCHDDVQIEESCILQRMSQESCEQETQRDMLCPREEDMHETNCNTRMLAGWEPFKEHPVQNARVISRPTCMQAASNWSPTHKVTPLKQHCVLRQCEDCVSFCFKNRRDSAKLLDAEKSLLASLERLDMKLAMASANTHNSSRTSLVSAGHQSTKSAPCVFRQKPGSDAYSINSTMFLSRPTTSQLGGTSLFAKRRQNIGVTNVSKDKVNHLQTCNLQHIKRPPLSSGSQKDNSKPAAGTIIVHQNAEFLFN